MTISQEKTASARSRRFASLATAVVAIVVVSGAVLGSATYYRYPAFAARMLARATGKPGFLPSAVTTVERVDRSNWPQSASKIPATLQAPLVAVGEIMRIDELRQRPSLVIEGATVVFDPDKPGRIAASKLTLRNSTLIANGGDLDIEVETLVSENSEIRAFALSDKPPAQGGGRDAGQVRLRVHGLTTGILRVDLGGQTGAAGAPGRAGQAGAGGAKGENAVATNEKCEKPAGPGAAGAPGGKGGDGGDGAAGGAGGQFTLMARDPSDSARHIEFSAEGGRGGAAGAAGTGGDGGPGGLGGAPAGLCIGDGPAGARGPTGPTGRAGADGVAGPAGAMKTLGLDDKS